MLREVLELEGLLMVADSRGDETPDAVFTLIKEKIEQLREYTSCLPDVAVDEQVDEQELVVESEDEPEYVLEAEPEEEIEAEPEPEIIKNVDETAPEAIITLDEAFIRNKAKDLKSAFSLNDTFRFRRELFGNSAADMNDAIDLVNAMNSYEEAEDYFINDLGWDAESDEVGEFMEIIRNHFIAQ